MANDGETPTTRSRPSIEEPMIRHSSNGLRTTSDSPHALYATCRDHRGTPALNEAKARSLATFCIALVMNFMLP
jgi:hypothetical protein